ncbi:hypothetical protein [uncultured Microbacterium sp.]|uniref:hypothetical protein n=1 Tax=uncultured Microbacterium sp. TaxID=191216 RepID=UPI0025CC6CAD|nr:hypothetical protein [uncultured Microbacterium sp.]
MTPNRDRSLDADGQPRIYEPADPSLRSYDRAVWALSADGEPQGHVACVVLEMAWPRRIPWLWFVVVWPDGRRELPFEDYGPGWYALREIDAGVLDQHLPSVTVEQRFLWRRVSADKPGAPRRFALEKLSGEVAARRWDELALGNGDF